MSNRWAGVRGWAGVGACSAEGVGDGRNLAKIRFRRRWRPKDSSEAEVSREVSRAVSRAVEVLLGFYLHKHSFDIGCVQKIEVRRGI